MEERVAVLEQIARDNRDTFRVIQDALLRLDAKMDVGFAKLDTKIDAVSAKLDTKIDAVSAKLDMRIDAVSAKLDTKIDAVSAKLDTKIDAVSDRIEDVRNKQERDFRLLFAALIAAVLGLAALMAHGFKWIS